MTIKSEIKEAKLAKAEEIKKKLNKLERIAGTEKIAQIANEFENEEGDVYNKKPYKVTITDDKGVVPHIFMKL